MADIELIGFKPDANYASPTFVIEFDLMTSSGNDIDLSSVNVSITVDAVVTNFIINGATQDACFVNTSDVEYEGKHGYSYSISHFEKYKNKSVSVSITANTIPAAAPFSFISNFTTAHHIGVFTTASILSGTASTQTRSITNGTTFTKVTYNILFQANEAVAPFIMSRSPAPNAINILRGTNISFGVHDWGGDGIDVSTLLVYINDVLAVSAGFSVPPYSSIVTATTLDGFPGYYVVVNPPIDFLYGDVVSVRVEVGDLVIDPTTRNILNTTYHFTIEPYIDIEGPSADPTIPPTGLALDGCIEFDWLDAPFGDGPEWNTLNVTLRRETTIDCITDVRDDIAIVNGVATPGYNVYASSITVGYQIGYHVIICPLVPFNETETITVIVNGEDSLGNSNTTTFSISTVEETPPTILNLMPTDGDTEVDRWTTIAFDMHDSAGSGVNIDALDVAINNQDVIIDGIVEPGYSLDIISDRIIDEMGLNFDGYHFVIHKDTPFRPGSEIFVEIDGYDGYFNYTTESYSFSIAPDRTAPDFYHWPPANMTGVDKDANVVLEIVDDIGIDINSINIEMRGQQVVWHGAPVVPFSVTTTHVFVTDVYDGYKFVIDSPSSFNFNERILVSAFASDISGNGKEISFWFTTYHDSVAPSITGISPRSGQEEVSLNPQMSFTVRDAYDVALNSINVRVGDKWAIKNGLTQFGFNATFAAISGGILGVDPGNGYNISFTKTAGFDYNQEIEMFISVADAEEGNVSSNTVSWSTIRPSPPLIDIYPDNGDTAAVDTNIFVEIIADGYAIDPSSIRIGVGSATAFIQNQIQLPDFAGTMTAIVPGYHYMIEIDPRFIFEELSHHTLSAGAAEALSGNESDKSVVFETPAGPQNPKTIYLGHQDGVKYILAGNLSGESTPVSLIDGYYVYDVYPLELKYINRLAIATRDHGALIYATNYTLPTLLYSVGDEITKVYLTTNHDGTLYMANKSKERVEVYYNVLYDDVGRNIPDAYYDASMVNILDGYFTDMVVTEGTSTVSDGSNSIFVGNDNGAYRIETDESDPGTSESSGQAVSYGIIGSGRTYDILQGTTNKVSAIDVNTRLNYLYVATRSEDGNDINAITYIDLADNSYDGDIPESRLINRLVNYLDFKE